MTQYKLIPNPEYLLDNDYFSADETGIEEKSTISYLKISDISSDPILVSMIKAYRLLVNTQINWDNPSDETWGDNFDPDYFTLVAELREYIILYMRKKGWSIN